MWFVDRAFGQDVVSCLDWGAAWTRSLFRGNEPCIVVASKAMTCEGLNDCRVDASRSLEVLVEGRKFVGGGEGKGNGCEVSVRTCSPVILPGLESSGLGIATRPCNGGVQEGGKVYSRLGQGVGAFVTFNITVTGCPD